MRGDFLREYYNRLAKEGFLKSLLWGLTIGFSALLASAFLFWVFAWKAVWVCAIVFVLCVAIITPIVYFTKYKPNKKFVAKRIDELGLEERMLTMAELEGNDSYIAIRQREDALNALSTINASFIRLAISVPLIVATIATGVLGASMTTVSALSASGVLRSGSEIVNPPEEEPILSEFIVEYEIGEGEGILMELDGEMQEGDVIVMTVVEGEHANPVYAEPMDGWAFVAWSDGLEDPYRQDMDITEDLTIYAIFAEMQEGDEGEPGEGQDGQDSSNKPQDGQPGEGDGDSQNPSDSENTGAGGKYDPNNQVIDGDTYYGGDVYDDAYQNALDEVNQDGNLTDDDKDVIGDYLENIRK